MTEPRPAPDVLDRRIFRMTFAGGRFDDHELPVAAMQEFEHVQALVAVVARELFRRANPDRRRLPNGAADSWQIALTTLEPNCIAATLVRPTPLGPLPSPSTTSSAGPPSK